MKYSTGDLVRVTRLYNFKTRRRFAPDSPLFKRYVGQIGRILCTRPENGYRKYDVIFPDKSIITIFETYIELVFSN